MTRSTAYQSVVLSLAAWYGAAVLPVAAVAAHPGMDSLITDLAVPISRLSETVAAAGSLTAALGLPAYVLGHVGDGNFHLTVFYDGADAAARVVFIRQKRAQRPHNIPRHQ